MARKSADPTRVQALLAAVRDDKPVDPGDADALAFLQQGGEIDGLQPDAALAMLQAAVELGRAEPVAAAQAARDKGVRKAARSAAHRLRSAGIEVASAHTGTTWSIGKEQRLQQPPLALVGLPEADGYVPFLLATFGDESACVSAGIAGPGRGFRDDDHGHTSRSQIRRIFDDAQRDHRMHPVPFHEAVAMLEQAFAAAGGQYPSGWDHLLAHLDQGSRNATRLLDPLRELATELDVDALHQPAPLLDGAYLVAAQASPDAMAPFLEQAIEVLSSQLYPDEDSRRQRVEEIVDESADEVLAGPARANWAWGLDVVAWLAHRAGDVEAAQVARATALALRADYAGRDVPWVREWASRHLSFVTDMAMRMGQGPAVQG